MIYLDNASTTFPKPKEVVKAITKAMNKYGANPGRGGYSFSINTALKIFEVREKIADFFKCENPENIIFTPNCTNGINIILKGLLKPHDHVIISCLEHNAVVRPLKKLYHKNINFSKIKIFENNDKKTAEEFLKNIKKNTKLIVCMAASNVFGIRLPIKKIAKICHNHKIPILVDAAQGAGIFDINIKRDKIDFLCTSGFKGLYGPMGTGILILKNKDFLDTLIEGGTGVNSKSLFQPNALPERFESGTINVPGIIGLGSGIDFIKKTGVKFIAEHEENLILKTYEKLKNISKIKLYTKEPKLHHHAPLISFNIENKTSDEVSYHLDKFEICTRSGLHCAVLPHKFMKTEKIGTIRISPSVFTKKEEIDYLIDIINKI